MKRSSARKIRSTQSERRRRTQDAVLSAALKVLREDGYGKFSASRVAAKAGVSRGAQEHYFPTKKSLVVAASNYAVDKGVEHAEFLAARALKSSDPVAKFLLDSEHFFFNPIYESMAEIAVAARVDPKIAQAHAAITKKARVVLNGIWIDTLVEAGYSRKSAQQFVDLTHHMLRGIFFANTWLPYRPDRRAMLRIWSKLAPAVLKPNFSGRRRRNKNKRRSL